MWTRTHKLQFFVWLSPKGVNKQKSWILWNLPIIKFREVAELKKKNLTFDNYEVLKFFKVFEILKFLKILKFL